MQYDRLTAVFTNESKSLMTVSVLLFITSDNILASSILTSICVLFASVLCDGASSLYCTSLPVHLISFVRTEMDSSCCGQPVTAT